MKQCEFAISLAKNNNGIITLKIASENNVKRQVIYYLASKGKLIKSDTGVYMLPNILDDEYFNIQSRFKCGVFSCLSALYLLGLTDVIPNEIYMTFPSGYNLSNVSKEGILCFKSNNYNVGLTETFTMMNNKVNCYNVERTLCDILRQKKKIDIRIITDAFKTYSALKKKNIPLLMEYASIFHVENKIRNYLEVLL